VLKKGTMDEATYPSSSVGVRRLEDWSLVRVGGDDAREWLNGQISNGIGEPAPGSCVRALVISSQGRVETELWVHDRGEDLVLALPKSSEAALLARFDRYIVMEDVDLESQNAEIISLQGPRAKEVVDLLDGHDEAWPCPRLHSAGFDWVVSKSEAAESLRRAVEAAASIGGGELTEADWELCRLRQGIPRFGKDFGLDTYPREVGLVESAVAFDKGCYVGQEAVVMLQHRGKPPRLLAHLRLEGGEIPGVGDTMLRDGRDAGTLTSVVADPRGGGWALGLMRRKLAEKGAELTLGEVNATVVSVVESEVRENQS